MRSGRNDGSINIGESRIIICDKITVAKNVNPVRDKVFLYFNL